MSYGLENPPDPSSIEETITELTAKTKKEIPKAHWKNSTLKKKEDNTIIAIDENIILYINFIKFFIYLKSPINYLVGI